MARAATTGGRDREGRGGQRFDGACRRRTRRRRGGRKPVKGARGPARRAGRGVDDRRRGGVPRRTGGDGGELRWHIREARGEAGGKGDEPAQGKGAGGAGGFPGRPLRGIGPRCRASRGQVRGEGPRLHGYRQEVEGRMGFDTAGPPGRMGCAGGEGEAVHQSRGAAIEVRGDDAGGSGHGDYREGKREPA